MADVEVGNSRVCVFPGCERSAAPPSPGGGPPPRYCDLPDHNPQADAARTAAQAAVQTAEAAAHGERDTAIDDTARREQYEQSPQVDRARRYARDHVAWTYDQLPPVERDLLETSTAQGWLDGWWAAQQDRTSDGAGVQREDDR